METQMHISVLSYSHTYVQLHAQLFMHTGIRHIQGHGHHMGKHMTRTQS